MATPILGITEVAPGQAQKEVIINDALVDLEAAANATVSIPVIGPSPDDVVITDDQFTRYVRLLLTAGAPAPTSNFYVTVPATQRLFIVANTTGRAVRIRVTGQVAATSDPEIASGVEVILYCDSRRIVPISGGGAGGGGGISIEEDGTDIPGITKLNFGAGITASRDTTDREQANVVADLSGTGITSIEHDGTALSNINTLNFTGGLSVGRSSADRRQANVVSDLRLDFVDHADNTALIPAGENPQTAVQVGTGPARANTMPLVENEDWVARFGSGWVLARYGASASASIRNRMILTRPSGSQVAPVRIRLIPPRSDGTSHLEDADFPTFDPAGDGAWVVNYLAASFVPGSWGIQITPRRTEVFSGVSTLHFRGAGVDLTNPLASLVPDVVYVDVPGIEVEQDGVPLRGRYKLNFGAGITAVANAADPTQADIVARSGGGVTVTPLTVAGNGTIDITTAWALKDTGVVLNSEEYPWIMLNVGRPVNVGRVPQAAWQWLLVMDLLALDASAVGDTDQSKMLIFKVQGSNNVEYEVGVAVSSDKHLLITSADPTEDFRPLRVMGVSNPPTFTGAVHGPQFAHSTVFPTTGWDAGAKNSDVRFELDAGATAYAPASISLGGPAPNIGSRLDFPAWENNGADRALLDDQVLGVAFEAKVNGVAKDRMYVPRSQFDNTNPRSGIQRDAVQNFGPLSFSQSSRINVHPFYDEEGNRNCIDFYGDGSDLPAGSSIEAYWWLNASVVSLEYSDLRNIPPRTFIGQTDTPDAYTGQAGKVPRVKTDETGLEFADAPAPGQGGGSSTFTGLTDTPTSQELTAGARKHLAANATGSAVTLVDAPPSTFTELLDTPANYTGQRDKFIGVNADADGLEFKDAPTGTGSGTFIGQTDTPDAYTGQAGRYLQVNTDADGVTFVEASPTGGGSSSFTGLSDTPTTLTGHGGKAVEVNSGGTALEFVDPVHTILDLTDTPSSYQGQTPEHPNLILPGHVLAVNSSKTGMEFVPQPTLEDFANQFTGLRDTPNSYSGQAGRIPVVNDGETALEFIDEGTRNPRGAVIAKCTIPAGGPWNPTTPNPTTLAVGWTVETDALAEGWSVSGNDLLTPSDPFPVTFLGFFYEVHVGSVLADRKVISTGVQGSAGRSNTDPNYSTGLKVKCTPYGGAAGTRAVNLEYQQQLTERHRDAFRFYGAGQSAILANTVFTLYKWLPARTTGSITVGQTQAAYDALTKEDGVLYAITPT